MCGIGGIWRNGRGRGLEDALDRMQAAMVHRGPDDSGTWTDLDAGIGFTHRRLAVVGLGDEGAQPMISPGGRWVLTYNGEIYNAPKLVSDLSQAGIAVSGRSDTEVLAAAFDAWGPEQALQRSDGMFAVGAFDREERRLILARDRMGEKPLVYGFTGGSLFFASDLTAIRATGEYEPTIDADALALYFRFKYVPAPFTIHRDFQKLPAGHWIEFDSATASPEPKPYWDLTKLVAEAAEDQFVDEKAAVDELESLLSGAVSRRLRSDVPLGAFLSGGIDSSLIATVAASCSDRPLRTFTIGSTEADLDERNQAREIASRIGADHTEFEVTPSEALAEVPTLASHWDEPFGDSSQLPTLLVSGLSRKEVTVVLSGDGGDELFGGYNRHRWLPSTWRRIEALPLPVRSLGARALRGPSPTFWDRLGRVIPESRRPRMLGLKVEKFASVLDMADASEGYGRLVSHWQDPRLLVPSANEPLTLTHDPERWPAAPTLAEQLMAVDALTYLPDDVLTKVDRATMARSLEARVPFLAPEVVEFAQRLPLSMKIRDGRGKWVLHEILARHHPRETFDRPKSGFGIPISSWLRKELRSWAEDLLSPTTLAASGLVDPDPVREAWAEHLTGRTDRSYELWDVLMFASWYEGLKR